MCAPAVCRRERRTQSQKSNNRDQAAICTYIPKVSIVLIKAVMCSLMSNVAAAKVGEQSVTAIIRTIDTS